MVDIPIDGFAHLGTLVSLYYLSYQALPGYFLVVHDSPLTH